MGIALLQPQPDPAFTLPSRWTPLKYHPIQYALWNSLRRFKVVPAGRRSGKTELAKRKGVLKAIGPQQFEDAWYIFAAPTHQQAKRIYWKDIKRLVPKQFIVPNGISESELTIKLITGAEITVLGLDKAERIEGRPIDWICIDEFGNCKAKIWDENIRPALSTIGRPGEAWLIGVPEGRNHYYKLSCKAIGDTSGEWGNFHWISADILDPAEIEAAKRDLDRLTYLQEYEASFLNFEGRAYYAFNRELHAKERLQYNPDLPIVLCFDFNVEPGVAAICQEQTYHGSNPKVDKYFTAVIGEVWIPQNSNTPVVCRKLIQDWGHHTGDVYCYGDATGGARGTAKIAGSDWDIIKQHLVPVFGQKLKWRVPKANPKERVRINAVNTRLETMDGTIRLLVDSIKAPHVANDFDGVTLKEGGSGEIDKDADQELTHISDALGYYIERRWPIQSGQKFKEEQLY